MVVVGGAVVEVVVDEGGFAGREGAEYRDQRPPGDLGCVGLLRVEQAHLVGNCIQPLKARYDIDQ